VSLQCASSVVFTFTVHLQRPPAASTCSLLARVAGPSLRANLESFWPHSSSYYRQLSGRQPSELVALLLINPN